ncbi:MAG: hypothetical protein V4662_04020 [Verrucomicrobiota bacterium]
MALATSSILLMAADAPAPTSVIVQPDGNYDIAGKAHDLPALLEKLKKLAQTRPHSSIAILTPKGSPDKKLFEALDAIKRADLDLVVEAPAPAK